MGNKLTKEQALDYEVASSLIAPWIWFGWGQELLSSYYAWKAARKHRRYMAIYKQIDKR